MRKTLALILAAAISAASLPAVAGDGRDAVIGSIIGGATGAVIGNGFGGRDGAIVGGAIGAAAGVAIATDQQRNRSYNNGYDSRRDDNRYGRRDDGYARYENNRRDDRRYDDRYSNRYDDRRYGYPREVVVVESPRHYYQGNEFVYGVPPRHDNGRHQGWQQSRRDYDRGGNVIIIQQDDGRYCPPPRRW